MWLGNDNFPRFECEKTSKTERFFVPSSEGLQRGRGTTIPEKEQIDGLGTPSESGLVMGRGPKYFSL